MRRPIEKHCILILIASNAVIRRRKWQTTPVFLPGESQGWGRTESGVTEVT